MSYPPQQPPYGGQPYGQPAQPAGTDRTQLWGILGIVIGLICCPLLGIIFGVLSIVEANKWHKPKTLGIIAIVASVAGGIIWSIINFTVLNTT
jgi:hypothetical protein